MSSLGIRLPLTRDSSDGFTMLKTLRQMTKQNFKMLLLTNPGERIMEPNFGVGLKRYLFNNFMSKTQSAKSEKINQQVKLYMPVIRITDLQFESSPDTNSIRIIIQYQIPTVGINDLLDLTI